MLHNAPLFQIYFGSKKDNLEPFHYGDIRENKDILSFAPYAKVQKLMGLRKVIFNKQKHGSQGHAITLATIKTIQPFITEGDFLATSMRHIGLGIISADCLPIIIFDPINIAIGIAHAGWRGSVESIGPALLEHMQNKFGTQPAKTRVIFGPSAKKCCYQVSPDFVDNLEHFEFIDEILQKHNETYFFDLPKCNRLQLENMGIPKDAFAMDYNHCTICNPIFCSVRSQGKQACRQMTIVALK